MSYPMFFAAALFEIGGCYAFWAWWKLDKSPLWLLPGVLALIAFAWILAQTDVALAGRAYAAYGGIYIVSSLAWMAAVERSLPQVSDYVGAVLCLVGAGVILFGGVKTVL